MYGEAHNRRLYAELRAAGHVLRTERGSSGTERVDPFALDADPHNGPACVVCSETWCQHCPVGVIEPCTAREAS